MRDWYKIRLSDIEEIYKFHAENGASAIRLIYKNKVLKVEILCNDDSEPYWKYCGEYDCTFKNWAIILFRLSNMSFRDEHGNLYRVICEWDWFNE